MAAENPDSDDTYSEAETAARADATLRQMLRTPPKPRKPSKAEPAESHRK